MVTIVGPPSGLLGERAVERRKPPLDTGKPGAAGSIRAAVAVIGNAQVQYLALIPHVDPHPPGVGVPGHVGHQFADREVRR